MGFCHESYGPNRASIETRSESFIIHMGYGYGLIKNVIGAIEPGESVIFENEVWKIHARYADKIVLKSTDGYSRRRDVKDLTTVVEIPDTEDFYPDSHPLAKLWNGITESHPHPEFGDEDLLPLLRALADHDDCPESIKETIMEATTWAKA